MVYARSLFDRTEPWGTIWVSWKFLGFMNRIAQSITVATSSFSTEKRSLSTRLVQSRPSFTLFSLVASSVRSLFVRSSLSVESGWRWNQYAQYIGLSIHIYKGYDCFCMPAKLVPFCFSITFRRQHKFYSLLKTRDVRTVLSLWSIKLENLRVEFTKRIGPNSH